MDPREIVTAMKQVANADELTDEQLYVKVIAELVRTVGTAIQLEPHMFGEDDLIECAEVGGCLYLRAAPSIATIHKPLD